jgi:hypothetical protein
LRAHNLLDKEHTSLKVSYDHTFEEHEGLKLDYEGVSDKLRISNKVRNDKTE